MPALFGAGAYCDARGVWRVPSSAVGRDREEDISISPAGIVDFGEHDMGDPKRGKRTAIDLVMEHGGAADASAAARWLADQLGIEIEIRSTRKPKPEPPELEPECDRWNEELHRNDRGEARDIIHNVTLILRKDERFKGRIRFNEMLEAVEAQQPAVAQAGGWRPWTDADDLFLADWCQKRHAYMKRPTCAAAVQVVARDIRHHPVRERLNSLIGMALRGSRAGWPPIWACRRPPTPGRSGCRWLISAVARVYAARLQGRPLPDPRRAAGRRQEHGRATHGARADLVFRRDRRPGHQGCRPGSAWKMARRAWRAVGPEPRRRRARQGVHVPADRPLSAELRHPQPGLPTPVRLHRIDQRRRLSR